MAQPQVEQGSKKVALLLPLSAAGQTGRIAKAMKRAAELAMIDAGKPGIILVAKDTAGSPSGARQAARQAIDEGAKIILGPLLAGSVKAVAPEAQVGQVPVVAFSSQSAVAGDGVYLMSFLPDEEVANIVRYAVRSGKRNIAALIPQSSYGNTVGRALRSAVSRYGASIIARESYVRTPSGVAGPARRMAGRLANPTSRADVLFFPAGPRMMQAAAAVMAQSGFAPSAKIRLLGTGLWDTPAIRTTALAKGGWYAGVEPKRIKYFDRHFSKSYGQRPPRLASLAYDATSLAIALGRGANGVSFSHEQITNSEGFQGMNGLFRFNSSGLIQRGLAILEVSPLGPRVVSAAPTRFSGGF
jgi:ABC-type branched-subunit amino acid transport system substrate-binding protein